MKERKATTAQKMCGVLREMREVERAERRREEESACRSNIEHSLSRGADMHLPIKELRFNDHMSRENLCGDHRFGSGALNGARPRVRGTWNDESERETPFLQGLASKTHRLNQVEVLDRFHAAEVHLARHGLQLQDRCRNLNWVSTQHANTGTRTRDRAVRPDRTREKPR